MKILLDDLGYIYLFLFSLYHIITGIVAIFTSNFALRFYKTIYGFEPTETKQLLLTFKPWGALALTVGIIGFFVFSNINVYYPLLLAFSVLLLIRATARIIYYKQLHTQHHVTLTQNLRMILIQLLGIFLFIYIFLIKI